MSRQIMLSPLPTKGLRCALAAISVLRVVWGKESFDITREPIKLG
jgi:hypothetical protein